MRPASMEKLTSSQAFRTPKDFVIAVMETASEGAEAPSPTRSFGIEDVTESACVGLALDRIELGSHLACLDLCVDRVHRCLLFIGWVTNDCTR